MVPKSLLVSKVGVDNCFFVSPLPNLPNTAQFNHKLEMAQKAKLNICDCVIAQINVLIVNPNFNTYICGL